MEHMGQKNEKLQAIKLWAKSSPLGTHLYTQLLVMIISCEMRYPVLHQSSTDIQLLLKQEEGAIGTTRNHSASEDMLEKQERNPGLSFLPKGCLNLKKLNLGMGNSAFKPGKTVWLVVL